MELYPANSGAIENLSNEDLDDFFNKKWSPPREFFTLTPVKQDVIIERLKSDFRQARNMAPPTSPKSNEPVPPLTTSVSASAHDSPPVASEMKLVVTVVPDTLSPTKIVRKMVQKCAFCHKSESGNHK